MNKLLSATQRGSSFISTDIDIFYQYDVKSISVLDTRFSLVYINIGGEVDLQVKNLFFFLFQYSNIVRSLWHVEIISANILSWWLGWYIQGVLVLWVLQSNHWMYYKTLLTVTELFELSTNRPCNQTHQFIREW